MESLNIIGNALMFFMTGFFILLPLGIWKAVDIVLWIVHHVKVTP